MADGRQIAILPQGHRFIHLDFDFLFFHFSTYFPALF
jgi:hypothetical protein